MSRHDLRWELEHEPQTELDVPPIVGLRRTRRAPGSGLRRSRRPLRRPRLGLPLGDTFTDAGVSGGLALEQRPALMAALDALGRGDVLIVAKRDRGVLCS